MKSRLLSNISTKLPKAPPFFIDRTCGGVLLAEALRKWEWIVHVHRERYGDRKKIEDDRWIAEAGQKNWRIITGDKNLETRYHDAIIEGSARIFVLSDLREKETYHRWVRMLETCKLRVVHASLFAPQPFVARISYEGHIYRIHHLLPHGKVRDVTRSVKSDATVFSIPEIQLPHAEAAR